MTDQPTIRAMLNAETAAELRDLLKCYIDADAASKRHMEAKMRLPPGSSRARVTTANARWAQAAEGRDHLQALAQRKIDALANLNT